MTTRPTTSPATTDVVVAGGGAAGSAVAALLALRGHRVNLLERERATPQAGAEALSPGIHPVLAELGLRHRISAVGAHRSTHSVLDWGNGSEPWRSDLADSGPFGFGYHIRYHVLADLLLDRAKELGATVQRGARVLGPVLSDGVVAGVRFRGPDGSITEWAAEIVVDATGAERAVAGHLGPAVPDPSGRHLLLGDEVTLTDTAEPPEPNSFVTAKPHGEAGWTWSIPLDQDSAEVGRLLPVPPEGEPDDAGNGVTRRWHGYRAPELAGTGWLCVGDAAGMADPLFLSPSTVALLAAQAAAGAIDTALASGARQVPAGYAESYGAVLGSAREFAAFCLSPRRQEEDEGALVRSLTALLNAPGGGATLARIRGALDGTHPLFDALCPHGPLVASLAMPTRGGSRMVPAVP